MHIGRAALFKMKTTKQTKLFACIIEYFYFDPVTELFNLKITWYNNEKIKSTQRVKN